MVDRIQLTTTHWLFIDGQPQLCATGTILDVPDATSFPTATKLSPTIPAGTLPVTGKPTRVRGPNGLRPD